MVTGRWPGEKMIPGLRSVLSAVGSQRRDTWVHRRSSQTEGMVAGGDRFRQISSKALLKGYGSNSLGFNGGDGGDRQI